MGVIGRLKWFGQGRDRRYTGWILNMELPGRSKGGRFMEKVHEYSKGGQTDGMTEDDISDRVRWS